MSASLSEGKMITYGIDEIVKVFSGKHTLSDMSQPYTPPAADMQRSNYAYWKPVQQQGVEIEGWDITGQETGVLELSIQGSLGDPRSDYFTLRADDLNDETSYRRRIRASAMRLAGAMEKRGLETAAQRGSFCVTDSAAFGTGTFDLWDGLKSCTSRFNETEFETESGTCAFLNPTAYQAGGKELVTSTARFRNNLPDDAYQNGMLDTTVAGFSKVFEHPKLIKFGAQAEALTVNGAQSFAPLASETSPSGTEVPFDNRFATLPVTGTAANVNVGDKFTLANGADGIKAVSLDEKIELDYDQTFTVVAVNGQDLTISPRPIALDDVSLTDLQKSYANINTTIAAGADIVWLNTTAKQANVVMVQDSMVLASAPIPLNHEMFQNLHAESFSVGPINGIIGFEGDLGAFTGKCRIAIWYQWNIEKPEQIGVLLDGQA